MSNLLAGSQITDSYQASGVCTYALVFAFLLSFIATAEAHPTHEHRYTDTIKRDKHGRILRRADVLRAFRMAHPCPSTGLKSGACKGWAIDHVIPLACYGVDEVINLQWLPLNLKTCKGVCKDRWERRIYAPVGRQWRYCKHPTPN